jgi:diguanylate cyclase (GGDEF)-like protein
MQPDTGPGNGPGSGPGSIELPGHHEDETFALALLRAATPQAVAAAVAARLPARAVATALWSPRWPQAVASDPPGASDSTIARVVREVSAQRAGGRSDPRYLLLCDDAEGGTALLRLEAPLAHGACVQALFAAAGARMSEVLTLARLRSTVSQLEKAEQLQRALYAIADLAGSGLDMPEMLRGLHRIVSALMYAENFYIALHDEASDSLRFAYFADTADRDGPPAGEVVPMSRIERGLTWYLVKDARPMMGSSEELRAQMSGPLLLHGAESTDWLGVPMLRDGRVRGALVVQSYLDGTRYTQADMNLLSFVAEHVLTALERKGAQAQLERHVEERTRQLAEANRDLSREVAERQRGERLQAALYRLAALASSEESSEAFYRQVHAVVGGLINARNFYIALLSDDGSQVNFPYAVDACETDWSTRSSGQGMTEYVMRTGKPQVVDTARMVELVREGEVDPRFIDSAVTSWLGTPLPGIDGVIGVVAVQSYSQSRGYDARDAELLTFAAQQLASSLQRRIAAEALRTANVQLEERVERRTHELREQVAQRERAEARLKHQVLHDPLTGLPNRVYLRDRLEQAIARSRGGGNDNFALLYIDVDRFKQINDSLGHLVGDDVLREVARRLASIARGPDVVARLSGDEFAILLERIDRPDDANRLAQGVIAAMQRPLLVGERELQASASVGIAIGDRPYRDADAVLLDADIALYRAKEQGRNRHVMFDDSLQRAARDTLALERQLRDGLRNDEFLPWFEPQVRMSDGHVLGHEALLRWRHPQRGVLAPAEFLQVAEDSGQLEAIDWRIYQRACEAAARLPGDGFVSVNVSSRLLRHADFDARLLRLAADAGLAPGRLRIEISEATLLQDPATVAGILGRLRDGGIEAALDDFGTGYSSLAFVHRFPLRMVKIDRSFIAGFGEEGSERSRAVLAAFIALARSLDLEVLAEGVETEVQRDALLAMDCRYGQGFLFGRARPLA